MCFLCLYSLYVLHIVYALYILHIVHIVGCKYDGVTSVLICSRLVNCFTEILMAARDVFGC